ncbi:hypothetical protein Stsp02_13450 [Streptomyces sp. NBRC 14336]|nr:hypothetical protein Stsp02_13450 [Streptomyces sp. NBRC 14336]
MRELVSGRLGGGVDQLDGTVSGGHYKAFRRRSLGLKGLMTADVAPRNSPPPPGAAGRGYEDDGL